MEMNRFIEMKEKLLQSADHFPEVALMVPLICIIVGFILWMIGARLVRVASTISSVAICALIGAVIGRILDGGVFAVVLVLFGAVVGGVLGWMAFRTVMAVTGSVIIMALVPMFYIFFGNMQPPPILEDVIDKVSEKTGVDLGKGKNENAQKEAQDELKQLQEQFSSSIIADEEAAAENFGEKSGEDIIMEDLSEAGFMTQFAARTNLAVDAFVQLQQKYQSALSEWWSGVSPAQRSSLVISMLIAFVGGGLLGFLLPQITASGLTAITGSILVMIGADSLLVFYAAEQADKLHQHPRLVVLIFAVMSGLGGMIQWRFRTRKPED